MGCYDVCMRFFAHALRLVHRFFHHEWRNTHSRILFIGIPIIIVVAAIVPRLSTIKEDVMFAVDHTAARAYTYGTIHMSANHPDLYDFKRAQYFLEECREMDPSFPAVNYQLSRIYFIQAHFVLALMSANAEIRNAQSTPVPEVYYMKGLIEGEMGHYDTAAEDYRTFLELRPDGKNGWAGHNDLAWILLKDNKPADALVTLNAALEKYPMNAWLLTSKASALYEMKRYDEAVPVATQAVASTQALTLAQWRSSYPGNNPETSQRGLATIRKAAVDNLKKILAARDGKK